MFIDGRKYKSFVADKQMKWLRTDLEANRSSKPVIIMCHMPLVTAALQVVAGWGSLGNEIVVENAADVVALLEKYQVTLALQGHTYQ